MLGVLVACGPEPTPFPVDAPPTATPEPPPATPEPIRYALATPMPMFVEALRDLSPGAQVEQVTLPLEPGDLGTRYDLVIRYGEIDGWTLAQPMQTVALVIGSIDPAFAAVIQQTLDPQTIVNGLSMPGAVALPANLLPLDDLRVTLANAGYPDGVTLRLVHSDLPGIDILVAQLAAVNVDVLLETLPASMLMDALDSDTADLAIMTWTTSAQRDLWGQAFGEDRVIDLYTLPISYLVAPGLDVMVTPGGWPLATRQ